MKEAVKIAPCHFIALCQIWAFPEGPSSEGAAEELLEQGLVERYARVNRWMVTPRGEAWLRMLLATPLPVNGWVDPRTGKEVS